MTTSNPTSVIEADTLTVRRTVRIAAPREKVWTAITEPEHIARWFSDAAELDGRGPGAAGTFTWDDYGPLPIRIESVDAPRSIAYRWTNDDAAGDPPAEVEDARSTVFTFTLADVDGGTELTVVETGFETTSDPEGNLRDHAGGWDSELDELVALLESAA
jgi:uncharacterized protein YndB with AHSA1/START domain